MKSKERVILLKFREINRDIFEAIKNGKKKIETRAATVKYCNIKKGDVIELVCGKDKFRKKVKRVDNFKTVGALVKKNKPEKINPNCKTENELRKMYYSFPDYEEKIKKFGIIALELI